MAVRAGAASESVPAAVSSSPEPEVIVVLTVSAETCMCQPRLPWFRVQSVSLNQNQWLVTLAVS